MKGLRFKTDPRLPLEGSIDFTYRCNNACRHCWVNLPADSPEEENELPSDEIIRILDEARAMACRSWAISGGEPMLRPDFSEIFDCVTDKSVSYSLNTNGTLINARIARLMKKKGTKMVALYEATAEVHDHTTRTPGSFESVMQGFAYLKEADAGFIVQIVPIRDNFGQFNEMIRLAESLSPLWRIGASWLHLSACGDLERNREIVRQRLDPRDVAALDKPDLSWKNSVEKKEALGCRHLKDDDRLIASCIASRRDFHVDPYGQMRFCSFIKDAALRYDLKTGIFQQGWDVFISSLIEKVTGGKEYEENCGSCGFREDRLWCPAFGYLEHRRFGAKVEYLCDLARETRKFKEARERDHRRYYQIAGITIRVESELPITHSTFSPKFKCFETGGPGEDVIALRHVFSLPDLSGNDLGVEVYRKAPWAIYRKGNSWIYVGISPDPKDKNVDSVAVFNQDHSRGTLYHGERQKALYIGGDLHSLTLFPTDQIIQQLRSAPREGVEFLARRKAIYLKEMKEFCSRFMGPTGDKLFSCGAGMGGACLDSYGQLQLCMGLRHPDTVYDVKKGSLFEAISRFFPEVREMKADHPDYLARCAQCFLKGLCEQCPGKSWTEHGTLDTPVEYVCEIAHTQGRYLGLLGEKELAWEIRDWRERIRNFSEEKENELRNIYGA